jgi:hypothetical protein
MTDEKEHQEDNAEPQVEVDGDPTVVYVPIQDLVDHPITPEEASHLEGVWGYGLIVQRGPRAGMTYVLPTGNTTVGRHPESDIFLNDVTVSRQHCRFVVSDEGLTVEDSGSTNGTYVNDVRVDKVRLQAGDEVLVGRFHFIVAHGDER